MAIALLLTTLLALAGLLATSAQGLILASALHSAAPSAGHLVTRHVGFAIPTVLFSLFSQSMVIFYFIGTGKLVKEEVASYPEPERRAVLNALRRFKAKTSPPATFALLSAIAVFVLEAPCTRAPFPPGRTSRPRFPPWRSIRGPSSPSGVPSPRTIG